MKESRTRRVPVRARFARRGASRGTPKGWLRLEGVTRNNLHGLDVAFPLGVFTAVTGVSGSGKSSLVSQALVELVRRPPRPRGRAAEDEGEELERAPAAPIGGRIVGGMEGVKRLVVVDQKPIGRTPRSNLATYTGLFDHVRKLFAATKAGAGPAVRRRAVLVQRRQGAVRDLRGRGVRDGRAAVPAERVRAVPDLPRVAVQRQDAGGQVPREERRRRARDDGGRGVGVLRRRAARPPVAGACCGRWGWATCGSASRRPSCPAARPSGSSWRPSCSGPSGGTRCTSWTSRRPGCTRRTWSGCWRKLDGLVEAGNTVVVVEHDMRVVAASDWVIDVGPGAGDEGGRVVASGMPAMLRSEKLSRTIPYLCRHLSPAKHPN